MEDVEKQIHAVCMQFVKNREVSLVSESAYTVLKTLIMWAIGKANHDHTAAHFAEIMSRPSQIIIEAKDVKYVMDHHDRIFVEPLPHDVTSETRCLPPLDRSRRQLENEYAEILRKEYVDPGHN